MKNIKPILTFSFTLLLFVISLNLYSQERTNESKSSTEEFNPQKNVMFNLGYGTRGPSGSLGFRYWLFGFQIDATGFSSKIPSSVNYLKPTGDVKVEKYGSIAVSGDILIYHDFTEEWSGFASIGFYSQIDSLFDREISSGALYTHQPVTEVTNGICFGFGAQYYFKTINNLEIGLGYHTKNGVFVQVGYWW